LIVSQFGIIIDSQSGSLRMEIKLARIVKNPEVRREELINTALDLFCENGYQNTAVSDIVKKVGVAQGTFYYYFKTKEELINSIIDDYIELVIKIIEPIIADKKMNAAEKIQRALFQEFNLSDKNEESEKAVKLHMIPDLHIHQKLLKTKVLRYSPLFEKIIYQGIEEGFFKTKHPLESIEIILVGFHFLFDPGIIPFNEDDYIRRAKASGDIIGDALTAKEGAFDFFPDFILLNMRRFHDSK
jgi:AcrR family transcriptional regulator